MVRAICDDLASTPGVVYAAVERRGSSSIGETVDYDALRGGPVLADLREELLPITDVLVIRVIYGGHAEPEEVQIAAGWARATLLRMLRRDGPVGPLLPPSGRGPAGGAAPAHAVVFRPGVRKMN